MRRKYSGFSLKAAMQLLGIEQLTRWELNASPRQPSEHLNEDLQRFDAFDLVTTEGAKLLIVDALLAEVVPDYPSLKVWKAARLETDVLIGIADYVIAPKRAYLDTPLLCVAEAKRDDFVQGCAQCLVEIAACLANNRQVGFETDIFGIVSNGQGWQFYRRARSGEVFETGLYTTEYLPDLLGALDFICGGCAAAASDALAQTVREPILTRAYGIRR